MARKGKEIQLQQEIETQEEWEDMLSKEGLCGKNDLTLLPKTLNTCRY